MELKSILGYLQNKTILIIGKELFRVLREKWGAEFDSFIAKKVVAVPGDATFDDLGVKEFRLREEMCTDIEIILNSAGTTNFDEREGLILEDSSCMDEMEKEITKFDFKVQEKNLVEEKLNELKAQNATEEVITITMKDFGIKRAKLYGWPNTYVFTKAMGEILLRHSKDNLSVVIIRPPAVTSTYKEPFPGWVQGLRTVDGVIAAYCKGKLTCLLVDPMSVFDMVPVDMVVNSITVAMVANANKSSSIIYHVGSSLRNPINFLNIHSFMFRYFTKNPWINKDGKPVKVGKLKLFKTTATFRMYMQVRFMLPLEGLKFVNKAFGGYFQDLYVNYNQKLKLVMRLVELYEPYMLFKGIFDDNNAEELRRITRERFVDAEAFNFDARCIDWEDYIMHTHIPGLQKYVMIK
ncbi:hypothetical protein GBA52_020701 [Prunus armeniaca]|nr:hypothetical protein GBA52_020701 [Prunus armeniaca]